MAGAVRHREVARVLLLFLIARAAAFLGPGAGIPTATLRSSGGRDGKWGLLEGPRAGGGEAWDAATAPRRGAAQYLGLRGKVRGWGRGHVSGGGGGMGCALRALAPGSETEMSPLPPVLDELAGYVGSSENEKQAGLRLVEMGDAMVARLGQDLPPHLVAGARRVPGCVSVVSVAVETTSASGASDASQATVSVRGTADARVAGGMLAMLVDGLEGQTADVVLRMDAAQIIQRARIKALLPAGRNNGMVNMLTVVQTLVREQLERDGIAIKGASEEGGGKSQGWEEARGKLELEGSSAGMWGTGCSEETAVLLSGGVDSSVALKLALEQGHKPRAFYLKIWLEDELAHLGECPWEEDWNYAKSVCDQLGVPLEAVSLQREYWDQVVSYLIEEAREGRTPNPDIMCNSRIKFGMFYDYVGKHFGRVATGHYAKVKRDDATGIVHLLKSPDLIKDQTYFLSNLKQSQLSNAMFPIGELEKKRVRELASEYNLPTQSRKDSQGICFLGKLKFEDFVGHHLGENPGPVVDYHTGEVLGEHKGLWFHTVGQRKGLGEACRLHTHRGPWYVAAKNFESNTVYVSNQYDSIDAERINFNVENINWIPGSCPVGEEMELDIKCRHGAGIHHAKVEFSGEGRARVSLREKDSGLAAGQFAAFYQGDECLGAGSISDSTFLPPQAG